ncbi:hypothetical protein Mapa_016934 [Marchantia paleacea]|nr:hypothetical protein Mapa_016934 [Marchantia paleacea]
MSTLKVIGDTTYRIRKIEGLRCGAKIAAFEHEGDEANAQIGQDFAARSEQCQYSEFKQVIASANDEATQAAADVDARRKQLFQQFEKERQLIIDRLQPEEMIKANYDSLDEVRCADKVNSSKSENVNCREEHLDIGIDTRTKEFALPAVNMGIDSQVDATMAYEEKLEKLQCEQEDHSALSVLSREKRPDFTEFSLLSHYLPSALEDRRNSTELELDGLSRQVQVLVHQLAGCRQNLLRAELEVGVLHAENRELRILIKDLLAAYSSP